METTLRIPYVDLIDATGQSIGAFNDDPSWWEHQKEKNYAKNKGQPIEIKENKPFCVDNNEGIQIN